MITRMATILAGCFLLFVMTQASGQVVDMKSEEKAKLQQQSLNKDTLKTETKQVKDASKPALQQAPARDQEKKTYHSMKDEQKTAEEVEKQGIKNRQQETDVWVAKEKAAVSVEKTENLVMSSEEKITAAKARLEEARLTIEAQREAGELTDEEYTLKQERIAQIEEKITALEKELDASREKIQENKSSIKQR